MRLFTLTKWSDFRRKIVLELLQKRSYCNHVFHFTTVVTGTIDMNEQLEKN